jgi:hypothetical protein
MSYDSRDGMMADYFLVACRMDRTGPTKTRLIRKTSIAAVLRLEENDTAIIIVSDRNMFYTDIPFDDVAKKLGYDPLMLGVT